MLRALYSAISALRDHSEMNDVIANNIANVNTIGYKSSRSEFDELVSQTLAGASGPSATQGGTNAEQIGLGAGVAEISQVISQGALEQTGNATDLAIQGAGYFQVQNAAGTEVHFTRAGNFSFDKNGDLVNSQGFYVSGRTDTNGDGTITSADGITKITIPTNAVSLAISQDGTVSYVDPATNNVVVAGQLVTAIFPNPAGLSAVGDSLLDPSGNSGAASIDFPTANGHGQVMQGTLEMSNVDLGNEFTAQISAERGFEANAQTIKTADEILQDLVHLRG